MKDIKWAVLGTGVIANEMAVALQQSGKSIYAVGNRTHKKAVDFAEKYGIEKVYDDFHEIFTDRVAFPFLSREKIFLYSSGQFSLMTFFKRAKSLLCFS